MKKRFNSILSALIALSLCLAFFTGCAGDAGNKTGTKLTIGFMSDIHCNANYPRANNAFKTALTALKARNVDVIMIAGDIVDTGFEHNYKVFRDTIAEVYTENTPEFVITMGNHDFWKSHSYSGPVQEMYDLFEQGTGQTPNYHTVVSGYHFIAVSPDNGELLFSGQRDWLENEIEKAAQDGGDKPIFVTAHVNAAGTVLGGASDVFNDVFKDYPQVVLLSGHMHNSMLDERTIFQGDFTSISLSSTQHISMPENYEGIPELTAYSICAVAKVYEDSVEIQRIRANDNVVLKQSWNLVLPLSKDTFTYTAARTQNAPEFPNNAKIEIEEALNGITLSFDAAQHDDMVYAYRINFQNKQNENDAFRVDTFADFFFGPDKQKDIFSILVSDNKMTKGSTYIVRIRAKSSMSGWSQSELVKEFTY